VSKARKNLTIGTIMLMIVAIGLSVVIKYQDTEQEFARRQPAEHPRTAFQMQAVTFSEGYDRRLDAPESVDEAIKVLKAAQILCAYLDEDPDLEAAWNYGTDQLDMSSDQTVVVIEEGIHAFCPRHTPLLQGGE